MSGRHAAGRPTADALSAIIDLPAAELASPAESNRRVLRRGSSTSFVLQSSGIALQYVTQLVFARALGAGGFGTYTYAVTWSRLAGSVSHLGGASSSLRLLPEYSVQKRWSLAAGVIRRFRQVAIVVGTSVALVASALVLAVNGTSTTAVAVVLALAFIPIASLIEVQQAMTRAGERMFKAFFPWLVFQPVLLLAAVGVDYAMGRTLTVREAVLLTGGSYVATVLLQAVWLRQSVPAEVKASSPTYATREWAKITLPIFASNAVYLVFSRLDIVMVGLLRSPRDAGIYAVAMRVGTGANILETAMASTLAPRISKLYWSGRRAEVEEVALRAVRWLFIPTLALTVVLSVFAHPILSVFGKGFSAGASVLVVIAIGQLVSVSSGAVGWLMNMTGQQNVTAGVYAAVAAATMIGYLTLIPWLGIVGAAIANAGALVARNVALNVLARQRLGYRISVPRAFRARL